MDWFEGTLTGKPDIEWENPWLPVVFPLNQSIDVWNAVYHQKNHQWMVYLFHYKWYGLKKQSIDSSRILRYHISQWYTEHGISSKSSRIVHYKPSVRVYLQDPPMQERGLDVLRLLSTRREAVTQQLCEDVSFVPAVPWKMWSTGII